VVWDRFAIGQSAESIKSLVAIDTEPFAQLGEIHPEQVSDVFRGVAPSNSEDGGATLVDPPVKSSPASSFDFPPLLRRQDDRLHG